MQFDADFYERRLTRQLGAGVEEPPTAAAPAMTTVANEAALLAIPDDSDFVHQAYRFYLRRDPDVGGLLYFAEMAAQQGRAVVIREIRKSDEASQAAPPASSDVARAASPEPPPAFADPAPAPAEVPVLNPELSDLLRIPDPDTFVHEAYRRVLGRPADPEGLDHHGARLAAGEPREVVLDALLSSDEARRRGTVATWNGQPWPGLSLGTRMRAALARVKPGAGGRRMQAELRRIARAHVRLEQRLDEIRDRQAAIRQTLNDLPLPPPPNPEPARRELERLGVLSAQTLDEIQRLQDAQRTLQMTIDSVATRADARAAETPWPTVTAGNIVAAHLDGFIIGLPAEEWRMVAYHAFKGVLEPGLTRRFAETLKPGMVVADVGANFGMYTLIAARGVGHTGRVYSFEPTPRSFAILHDNVQVNGFLETGIVRFSRAAVSDRPGTARFSMFAANGGHNTLFPGDAPAEAIDVETTTLDAALADAPHVDVVKIDAEGAEPLIWAGMAATRARNPRICVFLEFAPPLLARAGQDPAAFLRAIEASGFRVQVVDDRSGSLRTSTHADLAMQNSVNLMLTATEDGPAR